jgi:uncharacterized protein (TIGR03084 family)
MADLLADLAAALEAETASLERLLTDLDGAGWQRPTPAEGWSIRDQITHLAYFDDAAATAIAEPDRFRAERDAVLADLERIPDRMAREHRSVSGPDAHAWFRRARAHLVEVALAADRGVRIPWYGPDMSVASMLTARIMETWAHGQDVADALGAPHAVTPALRQVAHLGVRTLPNSFRARGREVPEVEVRVELIGPGGDEWEWGPSDATDRVRGPALDFCLVVTQRRHLADTTLDVQGPVAAEWMEIAQAFAGPPGAGRPPTRPVSP